MTRNFFGLLVASSLLLACGSDHAQTSAPVAVVEPPLDPALAAAHAQTYLDTLLAPGQYGGPICLPESVVNNLTQCSYSINNGSEIGTILCGNTGCYEGEAPAPLDQNLVGAQPVAASVPSTPGVSHHGPDSSDLLLWYLLYTNGAVTHHYYDWYHVTPVAYRTVYYTPTYRPSTVSINYYRQTYSAPIVTSSTRRFSTPTTSNLSRRPSGVTSSSTSRTSRPVSTVPTTGSRTVPTVAPVSKSPTVAPVSTTAKPAPNLFGSSPRPAPTVPKTVPASAPRPVPVAPRPSPVPKRSTGLGTPTRSSGSSTRRR